MDALNRALKIAKEPYLLDIIREVGSENPDVYKILQMVAQYVNTKFEKKYTARVQKVQRGFKLVIQETIIVDINKD